MLKNDDLKKWDKIQPYSKKYTNDLEALISDFQSIEFLDKVTFEQRMEIHIRYLQCRIINLEEEIFNLKIGKR